MRVILLSLFISTTICSASECHGVYFKEKYFNIVMVKEGINKIHELIFNRNENKAYFTFEQIAEVPTRVLGFIKLDTEEIGIVQGIRNATGVAVDQSLNRLYVGGSNGLYILNNNREEKVPEKLPVDDDITNLFVKDGVVYYVNRHREAFKFEFGSVTPLYETQGVPVDKLVLDDDNNILFLQDQKLFRVKIGTRIVNSHERYVVNEISTDLHFKPIICARDGIYVYNKYKYVLDKVSEMRDISQMAFVTADEPLYVVKDKILRLQFNPIPCFGD